MPNWRRTARPARPPSLPIRFIQAGSVPPQAWKNGGGRTRELLAWPSAGDWRLRISMADIESDGPFSAFPGVTRWFSVIEGEGVVLSFGDSERAVARGDSPVEFDGGLAPGCRLVDGPTRDLNLMVSAGRGAMQSVKAGVAWTETFSMRGLFIAVAGRWSAGGESAVLTPQTLVWEQGTASGEWRFEPDKAGTPVCGWWLGYTP